jgi:hypothetical protein
MLYSLKKLFAVPLWELAKAGNLKELDKRTSTAKGREEINTSKDKVRECTHSLVIIIPLYLLPPPPMLSPRLQCLDVNIT